MRAYTLELRDVSKSFSGIPAVDGVSFSLRAGEVAGYLGPNGSGKSTTMKMITGMMEMTSGEILFNRQPIQHDLIAYKRRADALRTSPHARTNTVKANIAGSPEAAT